MFQAEADSVRALYKRTLVQTLQINAQTMELNALRIQKMKLEVEKLQRERQVILYHSVIYFQVKVKVHKVTFIF